MTYVSTNNPNLVSYLPPSYLRHAQELLDVYAAWEGKASWTNPAHMVGGTAAKNYLFADQCDTPDEYSRRMQRSLYKPFFRSVIEGFAGIFSDVELRNAPGSFEEWENDVDGEGSTFGVFLADINALALRDGYVGILVDSNLNVEIMNRSEEDAAGGFRPLFRTYERSTILSVKGSKGVDGIFVDYARLSEVHTVPEEGTVYGEKEEVFYREITPEYWRLYRVTDNSQELVEEGANALGVVPFVVHSLSSSNPLDKRPPSIFLSELCFAYYNLYASYLEVMYRCNLPLPTRIGFWAPGMSSAELPPLHMSPNRVIDLPEGGDFKFVEPSGAAIASTREELSQLQIEILNEGLAFITREANNKTATEVEYSATSVKAKILKMAALEKSSIEKLLYFWGEWTNDVRDSATVDISHQLLEARMDAQLAGVLSQMATEGFLSRETLLREFKARGVFSNAFDLEKELGLGETGLIKDEPEITEDNTEIEGGGSENQPTSTEGVFGG